MKKDYFTWHWYLLTVQEQVKKVKNQFQMQSEWFNFISKYYNFCKLNSTFGLHISSVLCYFVEKVGSWRHYFKSWSFKSITFGNPRTAWKVFKYGVFSGPYFPAFGLNTERYEVSLRIQSECGKTRTRNYSVFVHFSHSGGCC